MGPEGEVTGFAERRRGGGGRERKTSSRSKIMIYKKKRRWFVCTPILNGRQVGKCGRRGGIRGRLARRPIFDV